MADQRFVLFTVLRTKEREKACANLWPINVLSVCCPQDKTTRKANVHLTRNLADQQLVVFAVLLRTKLLASVKLLLQQNQNHVSLTVPENRLLREQMAQQQQQMEALLAVV